MEITDLLAGPPYGQSLILLQGTRPIARLVFEGTDFPWIIYTFHPFPEWVQLGEQAQVFFTKSLQKSSQIVDQRINAIKDLDLWLAAEAGSERVGDFLFSLHEGCIHVRHWPR
jgi:hypothetical protein